MMVVLKTRETLVKFHLLIAFFILLCTVGVYIADDFNCCNAAVRTPVENSRDDEAAPGCDLFSGRWVYSDEFRPLYEERECSFMEASFACETYGRKDMKYKHWRWQPDSCDLPRFDGGALVDKLRGKKLVFVGDSLNRNQWVSLLCMIESSLPITSEKKTHSKGNLLSYHNSEYNLTIGMYWSPFLVESNCDDVLKHRVSGRVVRIESIQKHARHWIDADFLIFDTYTWWLNPTLTLIWGSFESEEATYRTVAMKRRRYEMALMTWSNWVEMNVNTTKTKLFFMSASPYTYKGDAVRHCDNKSEPIFSESNWSNQSMMATAESVIHQLNQRGVKVEFLRITEMSDQRVDAHPSIFRYFYTPVDRNDPKSYSDCLHWCLPGVPDVWNQILYAYIMNA